jgi:glycosyltransferase involved in cell wall biosynthesis
MNKDSKVLVILTPGFPKDETDTSCLPFLQDFIQELNEQFPGLKLIILAFDYPFLASTYQWNGNEVNSFNGWKKGKLKRYLKWLLIWRKLRKINRNQTIVGMLSLWCGECAYLGNRFAKKNSLSHFCWIQGQDAKKENRYVSRIKPAAEELIAISDFNQKEFERNHGFRPGHVIPVGIKPFVIQNEKVIKDIDILGVGSLISLKQYHVFVEVIHKISRHLPDVKAVLCGNGPEEMKLKKLIESNRLNENIGLTGELSHNKILATMIRSKVFLHPSNYEGLSVACLEALSSGCHVISFIKPMWYSIEHWHIVQSSEEMLAKTLSILNNPDTLYDPVFPFNVKDSVMKILQLYNYSDSISL